MGNITRLYTIFDRVAEQAGPLFHAQNDAVALRQFNNITRDVTSPGDYDLLFLGTFDHSLVKLQLVDSNISVFPNSSDISCEAVENSW